MARHQLLNKLSTILCRECGYCGLPSEKVVAPKGGRMVNFLAFLLAPIAYLLFDRGLDYVHRSKGRERYPHFSERFFCPSCGYELFDEDLDLTWHVDKKQIKMQNNWKIVIRVVVFILLLLLAFRFAPVFVKN